MDAIQSMYAYVLTLILNSGIYSFVWGKGCRHVLCPPITDQGLISLYIYHWAEQ